MAIETYIPHVAVFAGRQIAEPMVFLLHDPESAQPSGSLTTPDGPAAGATGTLVVIGTREGKRWRIELAGVEVRNRTALGFEYDISGGVKRRELGDAKPAPVTRERGFEERFDIR